MCGEGARDVSGPQPTDAGVGSPSPSSIASSIPTTGRPASCSPTLPSRWQKRDGRLRSLPRASAMTPPDEQLIPRETVHGVEVFRVWTSRFGRHNLAGRAIDYHTFYVAAAWRLWRSARADDIVIAKTDPPMLSVMAAPITPPTVPICPRASFKLIRGWSACAKSRYELQSRGLIRGGTLDL